MAKIPLSGGFSLVPEGTHIFKITGVEYKENFGKLNITMETQDGQKHIERFTFLNSKGDVNQGAYNAFSYFAKTAKNDFSLSEIDPDELVGCFLECDVEHNSQPSTKDPSKTFTYANLTEKRSSEGWDETPKASVPMQGGKVDLKALLG